MQEEAKLAAEVEKAAKVKAEVDVAVAQFAKQHNLSSKFARNWMEMAMEKSSTFSLPWTLPAVKSFASIYRNQGRGNNGEQAKEILVGIFIASREYHHKLTAETRPKRAEVEEKTFKNMLHFLVFSVARCAFWPKIMPKHCFFCNISIFLLPKFQKNRFRLSIFSISIMKKPCHGIENFFAR